MHNTSAQSPRIGATPFGLALLAILLLPACEPGQLKEGLAPDDNAVVSVSVTADRTAIVVGETVLIRASAQGTGGGSAPAEVDWSADGGNIVPVTDSTAVFSAPITGAFKVRGRGRRNRNAQDSTTITVSQPVSPIVDVAVSPKPASLTFGQIQAFVATASRQDGTTLTPSVTWAATGGSITTAGVYTAGTAPGTFRVVATEQGSGLADTSAVTVSAVPPTLQAVVLNPASASLFTGGARQFSVSGQWSDGSTSAPAVTYSATGGTITASGLYTGGGTPGTFRVIATQQGGTLADTAAITLTAPVLQAVVLSPSSAALGTGATQQFSVSGQWSNGATTPPAVTYVATGGSITTSGLYTAGSTAGTFRVIATQQGGTLADTSIVTLSTTPPVLQAVVLTPASASVIAGTTRQFAVSGQWSDGSTTAPAVTYSATGGTISSGGLYTAGGTPGTFRVIATQQGGSLADTAAVTVTAPVLQAVVLTPATVALQAGSTQQFAVSGIWDNGATTAPAVTYSATGGTISAGGLYTAGSVAGTFRVIARHQGGTLADTASVTISAPVLQAVILTPSSASLFTGGSQQFSVAGQWSNGSTSAPAVTYTATGGTITAGGLYTGGSTPGAFRVIATQQGGTLADTATVNLTAPVLQGIVLSPASSTVTTGGTQQFTVTGQWSNGATTAPAVTYSATGGTISNAGLFTAGGTIGAFRVIAVQQGGSLADTANVTVAALGSGWLAHKPANFTNVITDYGFDAPIPSATSDQPMGDGSLWNVYYPTGARTTARIADGTGGVSPQYAVQTQYETGDGSGVGKVKFYTDPLSGSITQFYVALRVKWDANYEWQYISNKLFFLEPGHILLQSRYVNGGTQWYLSAMIESGPVTVWLPQTNLPIPLGQWVTIEFIVKRGTTTGELHAWLNGTKVLEYTGINVPTTTSTQIWDINDTWGGAGSPRSRDSYRWLDHVYIATP